ncbi:hypothetical protein KEM54_004655 [Ascosphaera aggregata]|nr:hypothetical protein KEM54_004655 [Ascosphaera aggregata]
MADYKFEYYNVTFPGEYDYVAHVEINRPQAFNAFHEAMWLEMRTIFTKLSHDSNIRAIVLSGAGDKAFTSGLDVKAAAAAEDSVLSSASSSLSDPSRRATHNRRFIETFQDCVSSIERCEKPILCILHGYSLGLAIDIACAADIRICARDTKFSIKEVDIGMAADIGTLSRLPKVVGNLGWIKEVAFTAKAFGAEEALRQGFVNRVCESKAEAVRVGLELAGGIAKKSPVAVQGTKALLDYSREHTVGEGLRYTSVWNSVMLQAEDVPAAILAGIQKREPTFSKL